MPLVHIVLCKVKPEVISASSSWSEFESHCQTLGTTPSLKPLLLECVWAKPTYEERAKGWNWGESKSRSRAIRLDWTKRESVCVSEKRLIDRSAGLYTKFESKAIYEQYRDHPDHKEFVASKLRPNIDGECNCKSFKSRVCFRNLTLPFKTSWPSISSTKEIQISLTNE